MADIAFFGDFSPTRAGSAITIEHDLLEGQLCVGNLEIPLHAASRPRPKAGPHLAGSKESLAYFRGLRLVLSLANNHIMDYGEAGLRETLHACHRLGIATVGAGGDERAAQAPVVCDVAGKRIGILACCETQFGIASAQRAGVAVFEPTLYARLSALKSEVDGVIVSIHGAAEDCPWPSPAWQDLLRSFIDAGATVVHGHHSHVPQGYEMYKGGVIYYGLGNFLVDPKSWSDHPNTLWSLIGICAVEDGGLSSSTRTAVIEEKGEAILVRRSTDAEYNNHQIYLEKCNRPLNDRALLTGLWQEASVRMYDLWYADWCGFSSGASRSTSRAKAVLRGLYRGMALLARNTARRSRDGWRAEHLLHYHLFACESHREVISTALGVLSGELEDMRTSETRLLVDDMMPWSATNQ